MRKLLAATVLGAALAAAPLAVAGTADASTLGYLQDLNNNGISVYDTGRAVNSGYAICNNLDTANGAQVVEWVYRTFPSTDAPTRYWAYIWVETSVENLCPWHDHRGSIAA